MAERSTFSTNVSIPLFPAAIIADTAGCRLRTKTSYIWQACMFTMKTWRKSAQLRELLWLLHVILKTTEFPEQFQTT